MNGIIAPAACGRNATRSNPRGYDVARALVNCPTRRDGWAKHAILYEFSSLKAAETNLADPSDWTRRVIANLIHAPHSPTLGVRIWPPVQGG